MNKTILITGTSSGHGRATARHYLEKTALPAAEISFLPGFDKPNSFYRAFRTWTGTTPESVRHVQQPALSKP